MKLLLMIVNKPGRGEDKINLVFLTKVLFFHFPGYFHSPSFLVFSLVYLSLFFIGEAWAFSGWQFCRINRFPLTLCRISTENLSFKVLLTSASSRACSLLIPD